MMLDFFKKSSFCVAAANFVGFWLMICSSASCCTWCIFPFLLLDLVVEGRGQETSQPQKEIYKSLVGPTVSYKNWWMIFSTSFFPIQVNIRRTWNNQLAGWSPFLGTVIFFVCNGFTVGRHHSPPETVLPSCAGFESPLTRADYKLWGFLSNVSGGGIWWGRLANAIMMPFHSTNLSPGGLTAVVTGSCKSDFSKLVSTPGIRASFDQWWGIPFKCSFNGSNGQEEHL